MPGCSRLLAASFAIAAAGLGGCGGGHEPHAPLVKLDSIEAGGWPVLSSGPPRLGEVGPLIPGRAARG